ncbi:MAG: hypothetical protein R3B99_32845 [Polyangiales bacterium]
MLALGTGLALRFAGAKTLPMELDLAAVVAAVEGIPEARRLLEIRLGKGTTELALNFAKAVSSALIQGAVTPSVDAARRLLRLREVEAREHAFVVREVALCGDPDKHPTTRPNVGPRPRPLPDGPIERYAEKATFASLGGASFGLASSQRLEGAAAGLFGATPRPRTSDAKRCGVARAPARTTRGRGALARRASPARSAWTRWWSKAGSSWTRPSRTSTLS